MASCVTNLISRIIFIIMMFCLGFVGKKQYFYLDNIINNN